MTVIRPKDEPGATAPASDDGFLLDGATNGVRWISEANFLSWSKKINPTAIAFVNSPYTPLATDTFLFVDTSAGAIEIDLATAASRNGVGLSIKDVTGHAASNNITIKPVGGASAETLDGYTNTAPLVLSANYDGIRISPNTLSYVIDP